MLEGWRKDSGLNHNHGKAEFLFFPLLDVLGTGGKEREKNKPLTIFIVSVHEVMLS
jgi:hypothetical protein